MALSREERTSAQRYNAASDFVDANVAAGRAAKVAFRDGARSLTYGDLQAATCRCARGPASALA